MRVSEATSQEAKEALLFGIFRNAYEQEDAFIFTKSLEDAFEELLYIHGIKPNQRIMPVASSDDQSFFTRCLMARSKHITHNDQSVGGSYIPLCNLLDSQEFDQEMGRLIELPQFRRFAFSHEKWLASCERSSDERVRRIGYYGRMLREKTGIYRPGLFERLARSSLLLHFANSEVQVDVDGLARNSLLLHSADSEEQVDIDGLARSSLLLHSVNFEEQVDEDGLARSSARQS